MRDLTWFLCNFVRQYYIDILISVTDLDGRRQQLLPSLGPFSKL